MSKLYNFNFSNLFLTFKWVSKSYKFCIISLIFLDVASIIGGIFIVIHGKSFDMLFINLVMSIFLLGFIYVSLSGDNVDREICSTKNLSRKEFEKLDYKQKRSFYDEYFGNKKEVTN